jgi:hypothetical protein
VGQGLSGNLADLGAIPSNSTKTLPGKPGKPVTFLIIVNLKSYFLVMKKYPGFTGLPGA